eukprot:CAMPEP_0114506332 /NCGR_PEP_ID=MMETSP0109-20121206/11372_1 /TAXON_ID=29199 /ORGANISM="Chlorarachnion reptans, Strain CCCM449" /LENGTH=532 /DNA_ID=CAMNT_0001684915 /DNA_START=51 /DNA_END=1649 /DNA_ORIENTATION=+
MADDGDAPAAKCLFSERRFPTAKEALAHDQKEAGFDFEKFRSELSLDFYGSVKLINFVRSEVAKGADVKAVIDMVSRRLFEAEKYMKPQIEEDALLFELDDSQEARVDLAAENKALKGYIKSLQETMKKMSASMRTMVLGSDGEIRRIEVDEQDDDGDDDSKEGGEDDGDEDDDLPVEEIDPDKMRAASNPKPKEKKKFSPTDNYYFEGYSDREIHEEMLKDTVRTEAYRDMMYLNKDAFEGKTVLDVGCGTGILCMFAAKAGAKRVIGVDASDMIDKARQIVKDNGLSGTITLIKGKVEDVKLPVEKVDIIVSEWMGYFLLFESMLTTVLVARDRWLAKGGVVYPDKARLFIAGAEMSEYREERVAYWKNVYGFDMSCMITKQDHPTECFTGTVDPKSIVTTTAGFQDFNILTIETKQLDFTAEFAIEALRDDTVDSFVVDFDTYFDAGLKNKVALRTGCGSPVTHWQQTVFTLKKPLKLHKGEILRGEIIAKRQLKNFREYSVRITYWLNPDNKVTQDFSLDVGNDIDEY